MKKITLLFTATLLALAFCSFSDKITDSPILVKAITTTTDTGTNTPIKMTYNGNKIVTTGAVAFTYAGDLITKVASLEGSNAECVEYTYDGSGRLVLETVKNNRCEGTIFELSETYNYIYNADGTVTVHSQNYPDGVNAIAGESIKYTISNGNVVREEHFDTDGTSIDLTLYEYDTKNGAYKNLTGADKLIIAHNFGDNNANNVVKSTRTSGSGKDACSIVTTSVYTYTAQGYPQTVVNTEVYTSGTEDPVTSVSSTIYGY